MVVGVVPFFVVGAGRAVILDLLSPGRQHHRFRPLERVTRAVCSSHLPNRRVLIGARLNRLDLGV